MADREQGSLRWLGIPDVRRIVVLLAVACCASGLALSIAMVTARAAEERQAVRSQAAVAARNAAHAAEHEIASALAHLEALATAPALRSGDLATMHEQMSAIPLPPGSWMILWDSERQLANTLRPFGTPGLPRFADFGPQAEEGRSRVFVHGEQRVSNLNPAPVTGTDRRVITVHHPVRIAGDVAFALSAVLPVERLAEIVPRQSLPEGWLATLLDRHGNVLVPTGRLGLGDRPPAEFMHQVAALVGREGLLHGPGLSGAPSLTAVSPLGDIGWTAVVEVPSSMVSAATRSPIYLAGGFALLLLACAVAAGIILARRIERPVHRLGSLLEDARLDQHRTEARHRTRWESTVELLFDIRVTEDGRYLFDAVNPAYERQTGLRAEAVVGREITDVLPPRTAEVAAAHCRRCVEIGGPVRYANTMSLLGADRHWEVVLAPVCDTLTGRPTLILGSARDITEQRQAERERDDALSMFRRIAETTPDVLYIYDLQARRNIWANRQVEKALGYDAAEIRAMGNDMMAHLLHPDDVERVMAHLSDCAGMPDAAVTSIDYRMRHRTGEWRWLSSQETVFARTEGGQVSRILGCAQDVTPRRVAEAVVQATRDLLQRALDALSAHIAILDDEGRIIAVNAAWRRFAEANGFAGEDAGVGTYYLSYCDGRRRVDPESDAIACGIRAVLERRRVEFRSEYSCHSATARRWFQLRVTSFGDGELRRLVVAHEDITEVKAAGEAVRRLAAHVLAAQDEERRRIARELHDSTAQHLLGVQLAISCARNLLPDRAEEPAALIEEGLSLIEQSQRELRTLAYVLHPPMLDEAGLGAALEWFGRGLAKRSGLRISVEAQDIPAELGPEAATALFRVAQEALTNVHRHAEASAAVVRIETTGRGAERALRLTVQDDGRGVRADQAREESSVGVGLASMRERLRQLGGRLTIGQGDGGGTVVQAAVPLPVPEGPECGPPDALASVAPEEGAHAGA